MAFRKRNIGVSRTPTSPGAEDPVGPQTAPAPVPGVRPSPIDGRPTNSTGTPSLDGILAGHAGLALGSSLLIEESGTTEYAGALLRYYAAEGIVQGHRVHVVGVGEQWGRDLPGLVGTAGEERDGKEKRERDKEKMKIAWRYERLGEFGGITERRGGWDLFYIYIALMQLFCSAVLSTLGYVLILEKRNLAKQTEMVRRQTQ